MIYARGHGSPQGQIGMKKDPYMMSMTKYEARVREMRRDENISFVAAILGSLLALSCIPILVIAGGRVCSVGWLIFVVGVVLASGGILGYIRIRNEKRELEEWRAWESETQAALSQDRRT